MNELNLHDLVSSPDFKEQEVDKILEDHYTMSAKPDYMMMIEMIQTTRPIDTSNNHNIELIVDFDREEMFTEDKGKHFVDFPNVLLFDTSTNEISQLNLAPIPIVIGLPLNKTLLDNVVHGGKTKEAIAIHIIDHLIHFMEEYSYE